MLKRISILITVIFAASLLFSTDFVPGKALFKTTEPFNSIEVIDSVVVTDQVWFNEISNYFRFEEMYLLIMNSIEFDRTYVVYFDEDTDINAVVDSLNNELKVDYAEAAGRGYLLQEDPDYYLQWALTNIEAHPAWINHTSGDNDILIAVLDSGIDFDHPDLAGNDVLWNENDFYGFQETIDDNDIVYDYVGHGTMVSGVIRAVTENGLNIAGLAGGGFNGEVGCKLLTVKVFNNTPEDSDTGWIADGINSAVSAGAKVINMSFYCPESQTVIEQLEAAYEAGVCLIAAAGNGSIESISFPASHQSVFSAGATDINDKKSPFSNYEYDLDICAPGGISSGYVWNNTNDVLTLTPNSAKPKPKGHW
ncbi:MAG TPA: hypothetical protein ENL20_10380 [Candidatus Cloacimonetes bacterium]|nr:hypothetical protein [Candidatus Cloacimonadota bacterium]